MLWLMLLSLAGWNPESVPLLEWAAGVLNRDYQRLRASRYGNDAASALIRSGRVALFLDGLDEMPKNLRAAALHRLGAEVPGVRIVLATRRAEYADATGGAAPENTAVIELCPVQPDVAAEFLLNEQPTGKRDAWREVARYIKSNPGSEVAKALVTPLTLTTAREAYRTGDPAAIINGSFLPVEDTITAQFLAREYPDPRDRHWLGCLARHLDGQEGSGPHDLEWWRLGGMLSPVTRILAVALATFVIGALVGWIIGLPSIFTFDQPSASAQLPSVGGVGADRAAAYRAAALAADYLPGRRV